MQTKAEIIRNINNFVLTLLENNARKSPIIAFASPLVSRLAEKNINKLDFYLNALCDNEGKIDIENIVSEMVDKVMQCDPFVLNTSFIGDITIGGGQIRCTIPVVNMDLVLNRSDIELFKNTMLNKNL